MIESSRQPRSPSPDEGCARDRARTRRFHICGRDRRAAGFGGQWIQPYGRPCAGWRAEPAVEFFGVEFDILEIMRERFLADEIVDCRDRLFRLAGQRLVGQRQQATGLLAAKRLA
jgi:hypothetical protein